jgi:hypothetical protein
VVPFASCSTWSFVLKGKRLAQKASVALGDTPIAVLMKKKPFKSCRLVCLILQVWSERRGDEVWSAAGVFVVGTEKEHVCHIEG